MSATRRRSTSRFLTERTAMLESTEVEFLTMQDGKTPPGFQLDAIIAGTQARIRSLHERERILCATLAALGNADAVKALIETTESPEAAQASVMDLLNIDLNQARVVLDLQLRTLSPQRQLSPLKTTASVRNWPTSSRVWPRQNGCKRWSAPSAVRIWPGTTNADGPGPATTSCGGRRWADRAGGGP